MYYQNSILSRRMRPFHIAFAIVYFFSLLFALLSSTLLSASASQERLVTTSPKLAASDTFFSFEPSSSTKIFSYAFPSLPMYIGDSTQRTFLRPFFRFVADPSLSTQGFIAFNFLEDAQVYLNNTAQPNPLYWSTFSRSVRITTSTDVTHWDEDYFSFTSALSSSSFCRFRFSDNPVVTFTTTHISMSSAYYCYVMDFRGVSSSTLNFLQVSHFTTEYDITDLSSLYVQSPFPFRYGGLLTLYWNNGDYLRIYCLLTATTQSVQWWSNARGFYAYTGNNTTYRTSNFGRLDYSSNGIVDYDAYYQNGYSSGYAAGNSYGYNIGYDAGVNSTEAFNFFRLFSSVFDAMINSFQGMFNFDILGVNLAGFLLSLLTLSIVVFVVRKLISN